MTSTRRLAGLSQHLSAEPAAGGIRKWLSNLFGRDNNDDDDNDVGHEADGRELGSSHSHADGHGHSHGEAEPTVPPAVGGVVKSCFLRPSNEERAAAGWAPDTGHFQRTPSGLLSLTAVADYKLEPVRSTDEDHLMLSFCHAHLSDRPRVLYW
jgi:hypothetical protein